MKFLNALALILMIVGAINWGLWGFFQFDAVAWLVKGNTNMLARLIYAIVGLAGVWGLGFLGRWKACCGGCCSCCSCKKCGPNGKSGDSSKM